MPTDDLEMTSTCLSLWVVMMQLPLWAGDGPGPHFLTRLHSMLLVSCVYSAICISVGSSWKFFIVVNPLCIALDFQRKLRNMYTSTVIEMWRERLRSIRENRVFSTSFNTD